MTGIFYGSIHAIFVVEKGGNQKTQIVAEISGFWGFLASFIPFFLLFFWKSDLFNDLILMDIGITVMNGFKTCTAIRAMDRTDAGTVPIFP